MNLLVATFVGLRSCCTETCKLRLAMTAADFHGICLSRWQHFCDSNLSVFNASPEECSIYPEECSKL